MKIDILTLFPKMFTGPFAESIIQSAIQKKLVDIEIHDLRKWAIDKRGSVDDRTYGGGKGMLLRIDVIDAALKDITPHIKNKETKTLLLDAAGTKFTHHNLILIAGHYEGVDHRVHEHLVDDVISIGDYVLTGGEIPAMVLVDSVVRLIPGVLEKEATQIESHTIKGVLEYPQYTRPEKYNNWQVPEVLLSGNHQEIKKWRKENALKQTN